MEDYDDSIFIIDQLNIFNNGHFNLLELYIYWKLWSSTKKVKDNSFKVSWKCDKH